MTLTVTKTTSPGLTSATTAGGKLAPSVTPSAAISIRPVATSTAVTRALTSVRASAGFVSRPPLPRPDGLGARTRWATAGDACPHRSAPPVAVGAVVTGRHDVRPGCDDHGGWGNDDGWRGHRDGRADGDGDGDAARSEDGDAEQQGRAGELDEGHVRFLPSRQTPGPALLFRRRARHFFRWRPRNASIFSHASLACEGR